MISVISRKEIAFRLGAIIASLPREESSFVFGCCMRIRSGYISSLALTHCSDFSTSNRSYGNRRWHPTLLGDTPAANAAGSTNMPPPPTARWNNQTFVLMSYNILAQKLIDEHPFIYTNHTAEYLNWNYRRSRIIDEIKTISPQILCLQEVQENHLQQIADDLKQFNFDFVYKKRTGPNYKDGCAIFYNTDLFELQGRHTVEYDQQNVPFLDRPNVALIAKLRVRAGANTNLLVATTHLLYNPKRQDVRLAQVQLLITELDRLSEETNGQKTPIILTGDFNLQPYSAPYQLITKGKLKYANLTARTLERPHGQESVFGNSFLPPQLGITDDCQHLSVALHNENPNILIKNSETPPHRQSTNQRNLTASDFEGFNFATGLLKHNLNLVSVFHHNTTVNGRQLKEATTYHDEWITVDYVFYSKLYNRTLNRVIEGNLKLLERYEIPFVKECEAIGKIPNEDFGSDHLSLAAKFLIKLN